MKRQKTFYEFFNEGLDKNKIDVKVKDLILFLQKFDPETPVYLDREGWPDYPSMEDKISSLIDDSAITLRGGNYLIINN